MQDPLELLIKTYLEEFVSRNRAAKTLADGLRVVGTGLRPLVERLSFRTKDVQTRAREFLSLGYESDEIFGVLENARGWGKLYRKAGYPAIFIEQASESARGQDSPISEWLRVFGEKPVCHAAILVEDIENAVFYLEKQSVAFAGSITGARDSDCRQVFAAPEMIEGRAFSVLELTERHRGSTFSP